MSKSWRTRLVQPSTHAPQGFTSLATPTYRGSTTLFPDAGAVEDNWRQDQKPYSYGLYGTPTTLELAARIAEIENGFRTFITPGGQSALALVYFAFLNGGDHALVPESIYGPNRGFADGLLSRFGVEVEYYPPMIGASIEALMRPNTRLVWCESSRTCPRSRRSRAAMGRPSRSTTPTPRACTSTRSSMART
jgi:cystathionine beta-lyase